MFCWVYSAVWSTSLNPSLPPNFSLVDIYNVLENFFIATSFLDLPHTIIDTFNPHQAELTSTFTAFFSHFSLPQTTYLVHSDIHPHNILFPPNQLPKLVDVDSISYGYPSISLGFGAFKLYRQSMYLILLSPINYPLPTSFILFQ